MSNSPFLIYEDLISPAMCEKIVDEVRVSQPDTRDGIPLKSEKSNLKCENIVLDALRPHIAEIEQRYDAVYVGTEKIMFQHFPENARHPAQEAGCESSKYLRKKWVKVRDIDLIGYLWLNEYNDRVPVDPRFEVMGGKLEFPQPHFNFSLLPKRGTMVIFPACPHFINAISPVMVGNLYQAKVCISLRSKNAGMWFYQPDNFPIDPKKGVIESWLKDVM